MHSLVGRESHGMTQRRTTTSFILVILRVWSLPFFLHFTTDRAPRLSYEARRREATLRVLQRHNFFTQHIAIPLPTFNQSELDYDVCIYRQAQQR